MKAEIPVDLTGQTVSILGGGASLDGYNGDFQGYKIGCNGRAKEFNTEMIVAIDGTWQRENAYFLWKYEGIKITHNPTSDKSFIQIELNPNHAERDLDWHILACNLSGFTAIAVAFYLKAEKIFLYGFDGTGDASTHNHYFEFFKGENIINVGLESAIPYFLKIGYGDN